MTDILDVLVEALHGQDSSRPRSRQRRLGPSSVGSCRRQAWLRMDGAPPVNETLRMAAILGTAAHKTIEDAFKRLDPFGERFLTETEVEHEGLLGHVDLYDIANETVFDFKTTTLKNMRYFPKADHRSQVQLYGWLMEANGYPVKRVGLIAIPRDGDERDLRVHVEDFRPESVQDSLKWIAEVEGADVPPPMEKPARFCENYCEFFGPEACPGL